MITVNSLAASSKNVEEFAIALRTNFPDLNDELGDHYVEEFIETYGLRKVDPIDEIAPGAMMLAIAVVVVGLVGWFAGSWVLGGLAFLACASTAAGVIMVGSGMDRAADR